MSNREPEPYEVTPLPCKCCGLFLTTHWSGVCAACQSLFPTYDGDPDSFLEWYYENIALLNARGARDQVKMVTMSSKANTFQPPKCPGCGNALTRVYENTHETYHFDEAAGTYHHEVEDMDILCPDCGCDVSEALPHGACNYDAKHGLTTNDEVE